MPTPRTEVAAAALGTEIFVIGGFEAGGSPSDKVEIYDTQTDSWSEAAPLPEARHHSAATAYNNEIWVIGGFAGADFNRPLDFVWAIRSSGFGSPKQPLNEARGALAAVAPGQPIVFGGAAVGPEGDSLSLATVESFDPGLGAWDLWTRALNSPRDHLAAAAAAVCGGGDDCGIYLYTIGGRVDLDFAQNLDVTELSSFGTWTEAAPMPTARSGIAAVSYPAPQGYGGRIYVFGGEAPEGTFDENEA